MCDCRIADSLERSEERNRRIAVGGPDVYTFRQIALLAAHAAGVSRLRCRHLTAIPSSTASTAMLEDQLGVPQYTARIVASLRGGQCVCFSSKGHLKMGPLYCLHKQSVQSYSYSGGSRSSILHAYRYRWVPLLVLRGMMAFLWLLSYVWAGATRFRFFAEFIQVQKTFRTCFLTMLWLSHCL